VEPTGANVSIEEVLNRMVVPDLWQQEAVTALREGKDVVVHAPTGAGKTLIFELWTNNGQPHGQAVFTVPTRALANDKLAEWRARGWDVGITTGDLSDNLEAPIIVATLETQKPRLIRGDGPALLAIDEYQMIADPDRGLNYEMALALAPEETQLLLTSGSVGNPEHVAEWLRRLGRDAVVVRSDFRPVPLEEVDAEALSARIPSSIRGYWPRLVAKAIAEGLAPILIFAPRRQAAEKLAVELARALPVIDPLKLSPAQKRLVGGSLAKLLRSRIAYHHSGLSYATRAGVIEPLAKAGQLRVVVATMGLAAGINFSLRSVALAGDSYKRDGAEHPLRPDEILQMFGRAGRRGIDEVGYVIVTNNGVRLVDAHACHLRRNGMVDWGALLSLMDAAAAEGKHPFQAAVKVQQRLFTVRPIPLGIEFSLAHPHTPCGLATDSERSRLSRSKYREFLNSRGEWEPLRKTEFRPAKEVLVFPEKARNPGGDNLSETSCLRPLLSDPKAMEALGFGSPKKVGEIDGRPVYGRTVRLAEKIRAHRLRLMRWTRRAAGWQNSVVGLRSWEKRILPTLRAALRKRGMRLLKIHRGPSGLYGVISLEDASVASTVDRYGAALWRPPIRESIQPDCARCPLLEKCRELPKRAGAAALWRRLGLVDADGTPTRRGKIVSFFAQSHGLAIAAALEDASYPLDELVYDLANLDAGFRFAREDDRWGGRLAMACRNLYGCLSVPGYLEHGLPPDYGSGAAEIVASIHRDPSSKYLWITDWTGPGDIDRLIIEWRSLLRRAAHSPELNWDRWRAFQELARQILHETP